MNTIQLTDPFKVDGVEIGELTVRPLLFFEFVTVYKAANKRMDLVTAAALLRERIKAQVTYLKKDVPTALGEPDILRLPVAATKQLLTALDENMGKSGKRLLGNQADGVTEGIIYQLGNPLKMTSANEGKIEITELEFLAHTYGDIEGVMAAESEIEQAAALLRSVAKSVDGKAIPLFALDQITLADGLTIAQEVLPSF